MIRNSHNSKSAIGGFTLLENVIACSIIAIGMAATYSLNGQSMGVLRMAKDQSSASQVLQQRVEHLRIANWQKVSNPTWIRDSILNTGADGTSSLTNLTETVTVAAYGGTSTATNTFSRGPSGPSAAAGNVSLLNENAVLIKWVATWNGIPKGKVHTRELVTVLGKGGVAK
jgi:Tfp pilus assembly protein PilV